MEEIHEVIDFIGAAIPVFGGKDIGGNIMNAFVEGSQGDLLHAQIAAAVALKGAQAALFGPAAVAVEDEAEMVGH
jgi:hypothetical protein